MNVVKKRVLEGIALIVLIFSLSITIGASEPGTPLYLGPGQEVRVDVLLEPEKNYHVQVKMRTMLPDAKATLTLFGIRQNNEVILLEQVVRNLAADSQWQQLTIENVQTPSGFARWELVLTAEPEGRYYWQGLNVVRTAAEISRQDYWAEKLAQGPFYTGLVVDARGLEVQRSMSPRIYSEEGQLLYGGVLASHDLVQERGVVIYGTELTPELLTYLELEPDYPYASPLIVQAVKAVDPANTSVVISQEDTQRVLEAMVQYDFFARYAVIFLID